MQVASPPNLPTHVILDTREVMWQFQLATRELTVEREPHLEHLVAGIFELLYVQDLAEPGCEEYVQDTYCHLSDGDTCQAAVDYCVSLRQLCLGIYERVRAAKLYSRLGMLWFEFDGLLGADIVLRLSDIQIHT